MPSMHDAETTSSRGADRNGKVNVAIVSTARSLGEGKSKATILAKVVTN